MTSCPLIIHIIQKVYSMFWIKWQTFCHWNILGWLFMLTSCFLNIFDCVTTENDFHLHNHRSSAPTSTAERYISGEHGSLVFVVWQSLQNVLGHLKQLLCHIIRFARDWSILKMIKTPWGLLYKCGCCLHDVFV